MDTTVQFVYKAPMCNILISAQAGFIIRISLYQKDQPIEALLASNIDNSPENLALYDRCMKEFSQYFEGSRKVFTLPYRLNQPPFYQRVLHELVKVPYGTVITYRDLSKKAGSPGAVRACGSACHSNPLPIIIPCHRVVRTDGLGEYAFGLKLKKQLLELEGAVI